MLRLSLVANGFPIEPRKVKLLGEQTAVAPSHAAMARARSAEAPLGEIQRHPGPAASCPGKAALYVGLTQIHRSEQGSLKDAFCSFETWLFPPK